MSWHTRAEPNRDIAVLLAQMVVICMQMRSKLNLVSPLTSCPISPGSCSSARRCHRSANLSSQINYNQRINLHLFPHTKELSCAFKCAPVGWGAPTWEKKKEREGGPGSFISASPGGWGCRSPSGAPSSFWQTGARWGHGEPRPPACSSWDLH